MSFIALLSILALHSLVIPVIAYRPVPSFYINLSDAPEKWFQPSVDYILDTHTFEHSFGPIFKIHNHTLFDSLSKSDWEILEQSILTYFPQNYKCLEGISESFGKFGHYVSVAYLSGWVYFHELAHTDLASQDGKTATSLKKSCTGILINSAQSGSGILHGRNMDQSISPSLRNVTMQHVYVDTSSSIVYQSVGMYL